MVRGFYRAVVDELKFLGFAYAGNAKGSHEKWRSAVSGLTLIVPNPIKSRHTANAILKAAGSERRV